MIDRRPAIGAARAGHGPPARSPWGPRVGRIALFALVAIHLVLPFTPANPLAGARIVVASLVLGATYVALAVSSYHEPARAFWGGFGLLAIVIIVASWTGVSPAEEGWPVKLALLIGLSFGGVSGAGRSDAVER